MAQGELMNFCAVMAAECFYEIYPLVMCMTELLVAAIVSSTVVGFG